MNSFENRFDGYIQLKKVIDETQNTKRFFFSIKDHEIFPYISGQFVELILPIDTDPKKCARHYTIASHNSENLLEFIINKVDGGAATSYLFGDNIKTKESTFRVIGPLGKFVLPETVEQDICFICTETGIAPFRPMIQDLLIHQKEKLNQNNSITLIFGTNSKNDLLYYDELINLKETYKHFNLKIILKDEKSNDLPEHCSQGDIYNIIETLYPKVNSTLFYLCGTQEPVMTSRKLLKSLGFERTQIKSEIFV